MKNIYKRYQRFVIPEKIGGRTIASPAIHRDGFYFVALGGADEIGMNMYLYVQITNGKREGVIVDIGVKFGSVPVQDIEVGNPQYIWEGLDELRGIVITHSHEDHVGAVPYLITLIKNHTAEKLANGAECWNCDIHATKFTANFLREKLRDFDLLDQVTIVEKKTREKFALGSFEIEFINITHSVPESNVVAITTPFGVVIHTGDWKLDPHPLVGEVTDLTRLEEYGNAGNVIACVCDSTNALSEGFSGSEALVRENIIRLVKECDGKGVILSCFASNMARLASCYRAAIEAGRIFIPAGRSLERMLKVARMSGYLTDIPPLLAMKDTVNIPKSKILWVCTGSQAEVDSTMYKVSNGLHQYIKVDENDVAIFSAREIPGNEKEIIRMWNRLATLGVQVITNKSGQIHVSGHPHIEELLILYRLIKPRLVVPVHGGGRPIMANCEAAFKAGVPKAIAPQDGLFIRLDIPEQIGFVTHGKMIVEGKRLIEVDSRAHKVRNELLSGVISISIYDMKITSVTCVGVIDDDETMDDREMITIVKKAVDMTIKNTLSELQNTEQETFDIRPMLKKKITQVLQNTVKNRVGIIPFVIVHIN